MAVPKRRNPRARRNSRRANHDKISAPNTVPCANCGEPSISHRVCPSCGHYAGREVIEIVEDTE
ncbi:MAG: 50S ribosomal protein L32 [Sandaracinaceae bacterium]|nr:50S ribosomal protein L32 [Sandaracinaceae bacterium]